MKTQAHSPTCRESLSWLLQNYLPNKALFLPLLVIISCVTLHSQGLRHVRQESGSQSLDAEVRVVSTPAKNVYDKAAVWVNVALGITGVCGIVVAVVTLKKVERQTRATEDAAKAARRSIKLQESNLVQWVDIQPVGVRILTNSPEREPEAIRLMLRWKVVNNTTLPFTVKKIQTQVAKDLNWMIFQVEEKELVPPANEGTRNFYPFFVEFDLDKAETGRFFAKGLTVSIVISVFYLEASGKEQMRSFGEFYDCRKSGMEVVEALGKSPTMHLEIDDEPSTIVESEYRDLD